MSDKRKGRPREPSGNVGGIPTSSATSEAVKLLQQNVRNAPMLEPRVISSTDEHGQILDVDKIGFLGADWVLTGKGTAYIETTDGVFYRLPSDLNMWARDVITGVRAAGGRKSGVFPTRIEFGNLKGRIYAEMLSD